MIVGSFGGQLVASTPLREGSCRLRDGRSLAFAEWGAADGDPLLAFHGAPGSRLWCPDDFQPGKTTTEAGVRLITVDRPGYGRSDPGRIGDHRRRGRKVNQLQARPNTAAPNVRKNVARRTRWYES